VYTTHYSNPGSLVPVDTGVIGSAKKTLDIAAYTLVDAELIQAILQAAAQGASVRLYLDRTELEAETRGDATLSRWNGRVLQGIPNVQIKVKMSSVLMHLKSYVVDGATLRDGSANFSPEGEIQQDNSLTLTDDPAAVAAFQAKFEAMWARPDNQTVSQAVQPHATAPFRAFHPASRH
jgi:phosphatidylserine/phosphatidylglycerophosphate/cardiolipin synthase-like enzyme